MFVNVMSNIGLVTQRSPKRTRAQQPLCYPSSTGFSKKVGTNRHRQVRPNEDSSLPACDTLSNSNHASNLHNTTEQTATLVGVKLPILTKGHGSFGTIIGTTVLSRGVGVSPIRCYTLSAKLYCVEPWVNLKANCIHYANNRNGRICV